MHTIGNSTFARTLRRLAFITLGLVPGFVGAQSMQEVLGAGDVVRITAFRYPDLTTEARIAEDGSIGVPMIGRVKLMGMTPERAALHIAERMKQGKYILNPQIDVAVVEARSRQVSVMGFVARPGRYMLEGSTARLTDVLAMAGGLVPAAADTAVVKRTRDGKSEALNIDIAAIIQGGDTSKDLEIGSGDSVFVPKAPVVYVYGEVVRGGSYRLDKGMTVMQAVSLAGGITPRGSERRMKLRRRGPEGEWKEFDANPRDPAGADDEIYVRESLF